MKETSKIYVDIASLLDLRAAILLQFAKKDELIDYLISEEYNFRAIDQFSIIPQSDYDRLAKNMPVDLIPCSVVTYVLTSLKSKLNNLEKRNSFYSEKKIPEVLLNIYPFELSKSQCEVLQNMLFVKLETNTMVTIIRMSPKEVTPYFIKNSGVITTFMYDFRAWIDEHMAALDNNKLTDTLMYFPSICNELLEEGQIKKITKSGFKDMYGYTEYLFSSVANINFLPVVFFSNLVTASLYVDKFNDVLKDTSLTPETGQENKDGDRSAKV